MIALFIMTVAAVLAGLVERRRSGHWPIEALLVAVVALDLVRHTWTLPAALDMAMYLCVPALSSWCALRVLQEAPRGFATLVALKVFLVPFLGAIMVREAWASAPLIATGVSCAVQVVAAVAWWQSSRRPTITTVCALVMLVGDVVSLAGPVGLGGPWWIVNAQLGVVAGALVVLQAGWLVLHWARSRWPDGMQLEMHPWLEARLRRDLERRRARRRDRERQARE